MSATTSSQDQDLQTYLDSFNKDIDEANETVDGLAASEEEQKGADDDEESETVYMMDQEGYYYFDSSKKDDEDVKPVPIHADEASMTGTTDAEKTMGYVFILDNDEVKGLKAEKTTGGENAVGETKEVYEFDETEEISEQEDADDPPTAPGKLLRILPTTTATDPNAEIHRCMHCDYTTTKRFRLSRHLKWHSDDRPFKCSVCERGFKTNASLQNHVNAHLGNKPHPCESCDMRFTTSGELVRHVRYRHTGEKPHKCTECDYSSVELSKLRRHMRCHTGERPYQCPHCTYASPDTFKLKRHMRTHTGEKPYECDICHARFTQSNSLKSHRLIHSVGDKPVFQCTLCPTTCGRKTDLRLHIQKLHHSDKPIKCRRCGKELPDRYSYKVHSKTHEGERCYRCDICPYASISLRHLEAHKLVHTDNKPFACDTCGQGFRQRPLLIRHINLYHNKDYVPPKPRDKVHTCPHCKRAFTHKGNLMRHMEMHDPESNVGEEKLKLKMGRMMRVSPNRTATSGKGDDADFKPDIAVENEAGEVDFEIIETLDEEMTLAHDNNDETVMCMNLDDNETEIELGVKKEPECKEVLAVQVEGGEQYMIVKVLKTDDEDDDDDEEENCVTLENVGSNTKIIELTASGNRELKNSFGFDEDVGTQYFEDPETKETIQLLEIIEDS